MTVQADYVIVTEESKYGDIRSDFVKSQIEELGFIKDDDFFIFTDKDKDENVENDEPIKIYFALRFKGKNLDRIADNLRIKA